MVELVRFAVSDEIAGGGDVGLPHFVNVVDAYLDHPVEGVPDGLLLLGRDEQAAVVLLHEEKVTEQGDVRLVPLIEDLVDLLVEELLLTQPDVLPVGVRVKDEIADQQMLVLIGAVRGLHPSDAQPNVDRIDRRQPGVVRLADQSLAVMRKVDGISWNRSEAAGWRGLAM